MADQTESTAMVAIQGPKVIDRLADVLPVDLRSMKRYSFVTDSLMLVKFTVFRSGYTGEDGVELIIPAKAAGMAMKLLAGKMDKPDAVIKPAGLGARDTLRLEAAMPLYGHELGESLDPLAAGLGWAVDLNKDFIGAERCGSGRRGPEAEAGRPGTPRPADRQAGDAGEAGRRGGRGSHQRHVQPDAPEEHCPGLR